MSRQSAGFPQDAKPPAADLPREKHRLAAPYGCVPPLPTPVWAWFVLAAIILAGMLVRSPGLGGPIVGYHSFNEAHYLGTALLDPQSGLMSPWGMKGLNPPLYIFLLRVATFLLGPTTLVARLLSTVAALGTAVAIFFLGKRLYGLAAGLGAAVVMALAPGSALVGRNIQIEATLGLVLTLVVLAWVIATDEENVWWAIAAGVFAGLAVLLKMQGVVIIPALVLAEMIRTRSVRRLFSRIPLAALAAFLVVGLPWNIWNVLHPDRANMLGVRATEMGMPDQRFFDFFFAREWFWLLSPVLAVAAIAGIGYLLWRRRPGDVLVLLALLANVVFYLFYHLHTYYLYSAVPFAALSAAALLQPLEQIRMRTAIAVVCIVALLLVPFALVEVVGKKLGYWSTDEVAAAALSQGVDLSRASLAVDQQFRMSWEPALRFNARGMNVVSNPLVSVDVLPPGGRIITLDQEPRPASADVTPLGRLTDEHVMPVFFGYGIDQSHDALFYFALVQPRLVKVGPPWMFGLSSRTYAINLWASLLSPSLSEKIRSEATTQTPAPASAP